MAGLEIKDLSSAAIPAAPAAEYIAVLKPGEKNLFIGLRNGEGLAVHFFFPKINALGQPRRDGMRGVDIPNDLFLVVAPQKSAAAAAVADVQGNTQEKNKG